MDTDVNVVVIYRAGFYEGKVPGKPGRVFARTHREATVNARWWSKDIRHRRAEERGATWNSPNAFKVARW